jgi:hypothetical protein
MAPESGTSSPPDPRHRNVGGTPGGLGEFLGGLVLLLVGGYLFMDNVIVSGSLWSFAGLVPSGLVLLPVFMGVALLFYNGKSVFGWLLTAGGAIFIFLDVIASLRLVYKPTTLFHTVLMLGLMASGIGLVARSLRAH